MPNWCSNVLTISHPDRKEIDRLVQAFKSGGLMQEFYPCPQDLLDTVSGSLAKTDPGYDAFIQKQKDNKAAYGYTDWYDWKVDHWGTKWDVHANSPSSVEQSKCGKTADLSFDSAWAPPLAFYEHMLGLGFHIKAYYCETGVGFCGRWENGHDDFYDVHGPSSWIKENIPADIDEMFSISENMREYEEDEEECQNE